MAPIVMAAIGRDEPIITVSMGRFIQPNILRPNIERPLTLSAFIIFFLKTLPLRDPVSAS